MGTTMRRLAVALAAAGLLLSVSCAKDEAVTSTNTTTPVTASSGGGAGTTEVDGTDPGEDDDKDKDKGSGEYAEACAAIEEIDTIEGEGPDDLEAGLALFEKARDAGPEELADDWDKLSEVFEVVVTIDEDDEEAITKMLELMEDPEFQSAAAAIDDFAEEECGLDIDLDPAEERDAPGGRVGDDEIGAPSSTVLDDDPTSISAVQAHLRSLFSTEDWYDVIDSNVTWGSSGGGGTVSWTVSLGDDPTKGGMSESDLLDVCDAMADYLDTYEDGDVEITISDADEAELVTRAPGKACEAA